MKLTYIACIALLLSLLASPAWSATFEPGEWYSTATYQQNLDKYADKIDYARRKNADEAVYFVYEHIPLMFGAAITDSTSAIPVNLILGPDEKLNLGPGQLLLTIRTFEDDVPDTITVRSADIFVPIDPYSHRYLKASEAPFFASLSDTEKLSFFFRQNNSHIIEELGANGMLFKDENRLLKELGHQSAPLSEAVKRNCRIARRVYKNGSLALDNSINGLIGRKSARNLRLMVAVPDRYEASEVLNVEDAHEKENDDDHHHDRLPSFDVPASLADG